MLEPFAHKEDTFGVVPEYEGWFTVISSTFDATAPVQSAMQLTRASRLYQVVADKVPGAKVAALLEAISANPVELLVVDNCHLYSSVPVWPAGSTLLVKAAGAKPEQMVWAVAMVPPLVGFEQAI